MPKDTLRRHENYQKMLAQLKNAHYIYTIKLRHSNLPDKPASYPISRETPPFFFL
jgi:hypothetical protein